MSAFGEFFEGVGRASREKKRRWDSGGDTIALVLPAGCAAADFGAVLARLERGPQRGWALDDAEAPGGKSSASLKRKSVCEEN